MKHFTSVLAFGDSHVAGCELTDTYTFDDYFSGKVTLEEFDSVNKKLAFPQLVADQLGIPCYNYALSGGSNDRSLRLLTQAVQDHPNSLVLFGYTCTDRKEFFYPNPKQVFGRDQDGFVQVGIQWENISLSSSIHDRFLEILHPYNNLKQLMFIVDNICTGWALDFLHLPLFQETVPAVSNLFTFESQGNYISWCRHRGFKQQPYCHYGVDAHQELAKLILNQLY